MFRMRWMTMLAAAVLLMGILTCVRADDAAVKKALMTQYDNMTKAFKAKDLKGIMAPLTSDVSVKLPDGKILGHADLEKEYKQEFVETKSVNEWTTQITKLEVKGDKATATLKSKVVLVLTIQGRNRKVQNDQEGVDVWVKTAAGWKLKSEVITKSENKNL